MSDTVEEPIKPKPSNMNENIRQTKHHKLIKIIALVVLTLQNAVLTLSMRHARTQSANVFISSSAVVCSEVVKLFASLSLVYYFDALSVAHFVNIIYNTVVKQPIDTLKVGVPSVLYIIQNNLLYMAVSNLDAATAQITYQLKILTTAMFAVCMLRRSLGIHQWSALFILLSGIVLVQLANVKDSTATVVEQNRLLGFLAAFSACVLSGFAGIYFEKILKSSDISVWVRNVQLSLLSIPAGLVHGFVKDSSAIFSKGYFFGFNSFVLYVIFLQAFGGLVVAIVVKYADNILKGFATSLAIILSTVLSIFLFGLQIEVKFVIGALFVIVSVFLYGYPMKAKLKSYQPAPQRDRAGEPDHV